MDVLAATAGAESSSLEAAHSLADGASSSAFGPTMGVTVAQTELGDYDPNDNPNDTIDEKRLKRMRRNRESAAQSRNRKKQYVEELESQVKTLEEQVTALHQENIDLRREHARLIGQPFPELRPSGFGMAAPSYASGSDTSTAAVAVEDAAYSDACGPMAMATAPIATATLAPPAMAVRKPSVGATDALLGLELLSRSASCAGLPDGPIGPSEVTAVSVSHAAAYAATAAAAAAAAQQAHTAAEEVLQQHHAGRTEP